MQRPAAARAGRDREHRAAAPNARSRTMSQYAIDPFRARHAADRRQFRPRSGRSARRTCARPPIRRSKRVIDGVEATERQLLATLERYGVKIIDTTDAKFDPNLHQAIAEVPGEGKPPGSDRECGADGLYDRRPAACVPPWSRWRARKAATARRPAVRSTPGPDRHSTSIRERA